MAESRPHRPSDEPGPWGIITVSGLGALFRSPLERILGISAFKRAYDQALTMEDDRPFSEKALEVLGTRVLVDRAELARIPRAGPVIVVANHPFGMIEGLVLLSLLNRVRDDTKIIANYLMAQVPGLKQHLIPVDPFDRPESQQSNFAPMRESLRFLSEGGLVAVFPAGEVSHFTLRRRSVSDPVWTSQVARLVESTESTVVPVHFEGHNGLLFQALGLIHSRLRTYLLIRELLNKGRRKIKVHIGRPIRHDSLQRFPMHGQKTEYLRLRTYMLRGSKPQVSVTPPPEMEPVASPSDPDRVAAELEGLPEEHILAEMGDLRVVYLRSQQGPTVVRELGREREITFRLAGEGTGLALDLSEFDETYIHLVVYDRSNMQIVGSYRMGPTDEILKNQGPRGLYTTSLFHVSRKLFDRINPALELGRSFVRPEYQKSYAPLLLLWKGIGQFVVRNPRYKMLFGPVSINADYETVSKDLMVAFLKNHGYWSDLASLVKAKRPLRPTRDYDTATFTRQVEDVDAVSSLISDLEADKKGLPILLRQYLKLGAELLSFSVDPDFGDVLDGMILTDLTKTEPKILSRYMGKEGMESFLRHHREKGRGGDEGRSGRVA